MRNKGNQMNPMEERELEAGWTTWNKMAEMYPNMSVITTKNYSGLGKTLDKLVKERFSEVMTFYSNSNHFNRAFQCQALFKVLYI